MVAAGVLAFVTAVIFIATPLHAQAQPVDFKKEVKGLVAFVREIVTSAREGSLLKSILRNVLDLQKVSLNLLAQLPTKGISECETQHIIKMAAAGVGSHEILSIMTAEGDVSVLSARLGLALAFVSRVGQQIEDKLSLSSDIAPELTAIIFGTNTTASIISSADKVLRERTVAVGHKIRSRRQAARLSRFLRSPGNASFSANLRADVIGPGLGSVSGGIEFSTRSGLTGSVTGTISTNNEKKLEASVGFENKDKGVSLKAVGGVQVAPSGSVQPYGGVLFSFKRG